MTTRALDVNWGGFFFWRFFILSVLQMSECTTSLSKDMLSLHVFEPVRLRTEQRPAPNLPYMGVFFHKDEVLDVRSL